ncbi:MAG: DMSO/selenate family reductase complex B subunit, partial [Gemmatimonadota bacterium]
MSRPAFHLDASACSGCKACQVACKDKHDLPPGVLWRRVYEVVGGDWRRRGDAWSNDVFAYNVSVACNHCERPICAEVCPATAITRRADGIVLIDHDRCMGCRYCEWACPYGALQYHAAAGHMTKCTLCVDELERGRPPACVAACPLRVLELGDRDELMVGNGAGVPVHPLPDPALTGPALAVTPHPAAPARTPHPAAPARTPGRTRA